ncbi:transposase [Streptomyces sp. A1547]|uniref:transposase n=1 Tax=Streptomyces sp. A1547 TaxID=2563105 RepID=UPI001F1074E9|nr:transposase [Streptomyces sp. A1547]
MLFPHFNAVLVERVFTECGVVHIVARTLEGSVSCPDCGLPSDRVHSCYERRLADTPVGDQPVLIKLTVRRLYCENDRCGRRTFVEQVGGLTREHGPAMCPRGKSRGAARRPAATTAQPARPLQAPPKRWAEGLTNAIQLHSELQALGYRGSYQIISDYLRPRRRRRIRVVGPAPPTVRQVTGWIMRHPDRLSESEGRQLTEVLTHCPELAATHRLVRGFAEILSTRTGQHLKDWAVSARAEELPNLRSFATGLEKDWDAVVQGLTTHWNSGPVEGRVNHIKMVKRQMFGRAKLPLLRKRVLLTAAR